MPLHPDARTLWSEIRNPHCELCTLHEEAQTVCLIGDGPVPCDVMVIGEAPGYREDELSRPFSGKSGRLLDDELEQIGLPRSKVFITNVAKCRPPENRTPTRGEIQTCRTYLDGELEAVKPKYILSLGNSALLGLTKKSGIMKHRGIPYQLGDATVFATIHPAAVLRNPRNSDLFKADLRAFMRLIDGTENIAAPRTYLIRNKAMLSKVCQAVLASEAVAYDVETNGFDELGDDAVIATISVSPKPGIAFVLPVMHPESPWKHPIRVLRALIRALLFTRGKRIAHNAKFDDRWLQQMTGLPLYADADTMLMAHMLDENRFKGLKPLATTILGVDAWGIDMADGAAMRTPLPKLARYNAKDTDYTLRLYTHFRTQLKEPERVRTLRLVTKLIMPGLKALTDVERVGLWVDQRRFAERRIQVGKEIRKRSHKLTKIVGYEANWNSPPQLARIMFEELGISPIELTPKGAPSTKESVLLRLAAEGEPIAQALLDYRMWAKYESTYFATWASKMHDSRLHANYKLAGTVTGRLSSGKEEGDKGRGLNAQQIPREGLIRGVIGSPEGWSFVEADYSQIELRIAAHYSQDPVMMRYFRQGLDIHMMTAMQLTGKPAEHVTKEERKKAKGVNFGFLFGMGWRKFIEYARDSYGVVVTEAEAKLFRDVFFDTYRKLHPWHERQRRLARNYHRVQSAIGRVRNLPDIMSGDEEVRQEAERQAINSPVQGLASDMMLFALTILHDMMPPEEARIVGTVHDSLLMEVREDKVDKWVPQIRDTMENLPLKRTFGAQLSVPIVVDITTGKHWGEGKAA